EQPDSTRGNCPVKQRLLPNGTHETYETYGTHESHGSHKSHKSYWGPDDTRQPGSATRSASTPAAVTPPQRRTSSPCKAVNSARCRKPSSVTAVPSRPRNSSASSFRKWDNPLSLTPTQPPRNNFRKLLSPDRYTNPASPI